MSRIITDSRGLVSQPKDPYWDGNLTRREMQIAVNQLSENDMALTNMLDTLNIVVNFILEEKLNVKDRAELDAFVAKKTAQLQALRTLAEAQQTAEKNPEQPTQGVNNGPDEQL